MATAWRPVGLLGWRAMYARYDEVAETYPAGPDSYDGSATSALLSLVGPLQGLRVLDLACGHGLIARELARRGASVTGIDLSAEMLNRAADLGQSDGLSISYVQGDAADQELLAGEGFDLVVCHFGLSDIDDLTGTIRNISRWLLPGGRFVFAILHPCFGGAADVASSWPTDGTYYDESWWRPASAHSLLRNVVGANHRMLSTYVMALAEQKLVIDVLVEPRPEEEWAARTGAGAQPVYVVASCRFRG